MRAALLALSNLDSMNHKIPTWPYYIIDFQDFQSSYKNIIVAYIKHSSFWAFS